MKMCRKMPALMTVAVASFGLSGCGNSGEGQIKVGSSVRKNLSDDAVAPKKDESTPAKTADGDLKGRLGSRGEN